MYHSYVSVKPASTTLSYSFFLWKYTVFKNFKKLLHIFSYVTTRGSIDCKKLTTWASILWYSGRITLWSSQINLTISIYKKFITFTFCFKKTIIPILSQFFYPYFTEVMVPNGWHCHQFFLNVWLRNGRLFLKQHLLFVILPWPSQVTAADVTCQNPKLQSEVQPDTLIFGQDYYIHFHDNKQFLSKTISWFE